MKAGALVPMVCWLALVAPLLADSITLKSGTVLEGEIVSQSQTIVQLRTDRGVIKIQKASIRRIVFSAQKPSVEPRKESVDLAKKTEAAEKEKQEGLETQRKAEEARKAEEEARKRRDLEARKQALWKRAAVPGWSQAYAGQAGRGAVYAAGTGAGLLFFLDGRSGFLSGLSDFKAAERLGYLALASPGNALNLNLLARMQAAKASKSMQSGAQTANLGALLFLGFYAFHLRDVSRMATAGEATGADGLWQADAFSVADSRTYNHILQINYNYRLEL